MFQQSIHICVFINSFLLLLLVNLVLLDTIHSKVYTDMMIGLLVWNSILTTVYLIEFLVSRYCHYKEPSLISNDYLEI